MEINIVSTILGALIAAVIGGAGWIIKRYILDNPKKNNLLTDRLEKIYAPLMVKLKDKPSYKDFTPFLIGILDNNKAIIPKNLEDWIDLKRWAFENSEAEIGEEAFLFKHIESNYHWLSKKAGYDFDKTKIRNKYLFIYSKVHKRLDLINTMATTLIGVTLPLLTVLLILNGGDTYELKMTSRLLLGISVGWLASHLLCKYLSKWNVI